MTMSRGLVHFSPGRFLSEWTHDARSANSRKMDLSPSAPSTTLAQAAPRAALLPPPLAGGGSGWGGGASREVGVARGSGPCFPQWDHPCFAKSARGKMDQTPVRRVFSRPPAEP